VSCNPITQLFCKRCVLVLCLARRCKLSQASLQVCESDCFGCFFVAAMVNFNILSSVNQMKFTIKTWRPFSNCQHRLQQASLYSWHIMTSVLHHDSQRISNQQPYFVKIFQISISSTISDKNFV